MTAPLTVRVPAELVERLKLDAKLNDRSMASHVTSILRATLPELPQAPKPKPSEIPPYVGCYVAPMLRAKAEREAREALEPKSPFTPSGAMRLTRSDKE